MRSSTCSMPTDRRTRSAGTSSSVPSTDMCVIAAGTSMSDSTPPRLSARKNNSVSIETPLEHSADVARRVRRQRIEIDVLVQDRADGISCCLADEWAQPREALVEHDAE